MDKTKIMQCHLLTEVGVEVEDELGNIFPIRLPVGKLRQNLALFKTAHTVPYRSRQNYLGPNRNIRDLNVQMLIKEKSLGGKLMVEWKSGKFSQLLGSPTLIDERMR